MAITSLEEVVAVVTTKVTSTLTEALPRQVVVEVAIVPGKIGDRAMSLVSFIIWGRKGSEILL